jgi:hypothetical protein
LQLQQSKSVSSASFALEQRQLADLAKVDAVNGNAREALAEEDGSRIGVVHDACHLSRQPDVQHRDAGQQEHHAVPD